MVITQLIDRARDYLPLEKLAIVEEAYRYASRAHEGQMRKSGDPYIEHPLQTAMILADLELDASALAAALLHDVPENCGIPVSEIEATFSAEVAKLVDATTKLGKLSRQASEEATTTDEGQAVGCDPVEGGTVEDGRQGIEADDQGEGGDGDDAQA